MIYPIKSGIQISLDGNTWYKITDHNRKEIQNNPTLIEKDARMANGTLRKYVIAKKAVISTSWEFIPSLNEQTVDWSNANPTVSSAWMAAFYSANAFKPVYVRIINATYTTPAIGYYPNEGSHATSKTSYEQYVMFITKFSTTTAKRTLTTDFANMEIEFTEI